MKTDTEAYKGRKFTCDNCGYVVSSDATDDLDRKYPRNRDRKR